MPYSGAGISSRPWWPKLRNIHLSGFSWNSTPKGVIWELIRWNTQDTHIINSPKTMNLKVLMITLATQDQKKQNSLTNCNLMWPGKKNVIFHQRNYFINTYSHERCKYHESVGHVWSMEYPRGRGMSKLSGYIQRDHSCQTPNPLSWCQPTRSFSPHKSTLWLAWTYDTITSSALNMRDGRKACLYVTLSSSERNYENWHFLNSACGYSIWNKYPSMSAYKRQ